MPQKDKTEKLKSLLKLVNEGLTREEFLESFKKVVDHTLKTEISLIEKIDFKTKEEKDRMEELAREFGDVIDKAKRESDSSLSGFRNRTMEAISKLFTRNEVNKKLKEIIGSAESVIENMNRKMNLVRDGVDGLDGVDGKDIDSTELIKEVLNQIEVPKLDLTELERLKKEIEELKKLGRLRGGGTSALGIANAAKYFVKTEKPTGTIDGANKAFTVAKPIFAVLSFSLNGEFIAQLPNYTISNKTVTFSEAIPAAYATKDFEITYI